MEAIILSFFAIVFAMIGSGKPREIVVFLALGSGQIHLAFVAILIFFISGLGYRIPTSYPKYIIAFIITTISIVLSIGIVSAIDLRVISELVQFFLYITLFLLAYGYFIKVNKLPRLLDSMIIAATIFSLIGITGALTGLSHSPHIFFGRGANEGAIYILFSGVIPAMALFHQNKKPIYLIASSVMLYAMILATSRSSLVLTSIIMLTPLYLAAVQQKIIRTIVLIALTFSLWELSNYVYDIIDEQLNYSSLERLLLYQSGWDLWLSKPITGWGWGSTSNLAPSFSLSDKIYPHFHSTYIQFIVELGASGVLLSLLWISLSLKIILFGVKKIHSPLVTAYATMLSIALLGSGFTSALFFGADRAIQVIISLAIIISMMQHEKHNHTLNTHIT